MAGQPTLGSKVFGPLHVVHRLEGLGLLARKGLLVIVLAGPTDAVEKDASRRSMSKEVKDEEDDGHQDHRPERREEGDDDAIQPRAVVVHLDGFRAGSCVAQSRCVDGRFVASSIRDRFACLLRSRSVSGDMREWVVRRGFWVQPMTERLRGRPREWAWSSLDCSREVVDSMSLARWRRGWSGIRR